MQTCECNVRRKKGGWRVWRLWSLSWHSHIPGGFLNERATPSPSFLSLISLWPKGHVFSQLHKQLIINSTGFSSLSSRIQKRNFSCLWSLPVCVRATAPCLPGFFLPVDEIHAGIIHPSVFSVCLLTGAGSNPDGGSGFQSGIWVLAGFQGRYAQLLLTICVWQMSNNLLVLFSHYCTHLLSSFFCLLIVRLTH